MIAFKSFPKIFQGLLKIAIALVLMMGSSLVVTPALAAGIVVTTTNDELNKDGDCSLREAIQAANTDLAVDACAAGSGADTITVLAGRYTLTITGTGEDANATGDLDITDSLSISGAGATITTIQAGTTLGSGIDRVFDVFGTINVSISDVTIANGMCISCGGGGIRNTSTLTVTNSTFSTNTAYSGGGILNEGATLTVTNSTFSTNSASNTGGGINAAGTESVTNSTFSTNSAAYGGGIYNKFYGLTVTNSTFLGNHAIINGGGIANENDSGLIDFNSATLTNSTFSGDYADLEGGGIYNNSTLHLKNTLLANSGPSDCYNDIGGTIALDSTHNLIETNGAGANACGTPSVTADPNLGTLTGSPAYFPLNIGSPALDAGDDAICLAAPVGNASQNGVTRPRGAHCDIGSFELFIYILFLPLILR